MEKRFYAVSNAHMDTQWNWTVQDTIRDYIKNTLEENFRNFRNAPKYLFNFEGAFKYKLMAEYYPEHYKKLREYVAEGRWMPSGAFWDSCDVNVPSSEALMRQALLGNKYFENEFGIFTKDIFLPDCFGFRASVPSIAKHMGLLGFSTQKLTWGVGCPIVNEDGSVSRPEVGKHTRLDLGKWKGPDGEEIFVSLDGGAYVYQFPQEDTPVDKREDILKAIEKNEQISHFPWRMQYFGVGDVGGACTTKCAKMASDAEESTDGLYSVINAHTYRIFEDLEKEDTSALPLYEGQLHIPHGFGALTSHTISKRLNRLCENLGDAAERASVLASLYTDHVYPKEKLTDAWKTFLWHQFHDDLTGTSICTAYVFSHNDYVIALNQFAAELTASIGAIGDVLDTNVIGTPVVLFNQIGHKRVGTVVCDMEIDSEFVSVFDENNNEVPSQIVVKDGKKTVLFEATLPAVGVAVYDVRKSDAPYVGALSVTERTLENSFYRVTLDDNGDIASVYDKELDKELLSAPVRLEISPDTSSVWPSWELNFDDLKKEHFFVKDNVSIEIVENGAVSVALKITRTYEGSTFVQTVRLTSSEKTVSVDNYVNWFSRNALLKATFPLSASNPIAEFDLGLGADRGGNTDSYPYFEHCVHTYADLTDTSGDFGVAILNDSKYGMDKPNDHTLRLTLIHTPDSPFSEESHQDWQDFGRNEFRFAITSHKGARDGVALIAEEFNKPIYAFSADKHTADKKSLSLVESSDSEVLIRCVKKAEDTDDIIVRVQEMAGTDHASASLTFLPSVTAAHETNGYETVIGTANLQNNVLEFPIGHYAPKTFSVALNAKKEKTPATVYTVLPLSYTVNFVTDNGFGSTEADVTIPSALYNETVVSSGIPFSLGKTEGNNAACGVETAITLPEGAKTLYLLCAAPRSTTCTLKLDEMPYELKVSGFTENVGSWDMIALNQKCFVNHDEIAAVYTHTHDERGNDRYYEFAYLFKYAIDVENVSTVTVPENLILFAATASNQKDTVKSYQTLYPIAEKDTRPCLKLSVIGGKEDLLLPAGDMTLVTAPDNDPEALFECWEGDCIITTAGMTALVKMPDHDTAVSVKRRYIGKNLSLKKPTEASISENGSETPDHAVNGIADEKWCGFVGENGAWMSIDLEKAVTFDRWLVKHSGKQEGSEWNTSDFALEYRLDDTAEWIRADEVVGNTEDVTLRDLAPITARFVRLFITKPSQGEDGDPHARIYEFAVFKK